MFYFSSHTCCGIWVKLGDTITRCVTLKICVAYSESLVVNCASFIVFCQQDLVQQVLLPLSVCMCVCVCVCVCVRVHA